MRLAAFACCFLLSTIGSAAEVDRVGVMRAAIELACNAEGRSDLNLIGHRLPGIVPVDPLPQETRLVNGWRRVYPLDIGHLFIDWLAPRGAALSYPFAARPGRSGDAGSLRPGGCSLQD